MRLLLLSLFLLEETAKCSKSYLVKTKDRKTYLEFANPRDLAGGDSNWPSVSTETDKSEYYPRQLFSLESVACHMDGGGWAFLDKTFIFSLLLCHLGNLGGCVSW